MRGLLLCPADDGQGGGGGSTPNPADKTTQQVKDDDAGTEPAAKNTPGDGGDAKTDTKDDDPAARQLEQIEQIAEKRNRNARILDKGLSGLEKFVKIPHRPAGYREVYQLYLASFQRRDELLKYLIENGIEAKVHYPIPLHLQNAAKQYGYKAGDFPVAEKQAKEIITLPSHQHLSEEQMNYTVDRIRAFYL
jgi:hypothetical protein